jgi:Protein of unknown function (DUF4065)
MHNDDMDNDQTLNSEKLQQAILFFLHGSPDGNVSKTRLMTLLYFADFDFYERFEQPITGARYRKVNQSPESVEAARMLAALEQGERIKRREDMMEERNLTRYDTHERADLSAFTIPERTVLEQIQREWASASDECLERAIREEAPLVAVSPNEDIPYYLAHYRNTYGAMRLDDDELAAMAQAHDEDEVVAR